jgi:hypothetical protein
MQWLSFVRGHLFRGTTSRLFHGFTPTRVSRCNGFLLVEVIYSEGQPFGPFMTVHSVDMNLLQDLKLWFYLLYLD